MLLLDAAILQNSTWPAPDRPPFGAGLSGAPSGFRIADQPPHRLARPASSSLRLLSVGLHAGDG
jgi:hypothetical protein